MFSFNCSRNRKQDPSINLLIGQCLIALGDFKQKGYYDLVLKSNPHNGEANFNQGLIAMVLGEPFEGYCKNAENMMLYFDKEQGKLSDIEKFIQIRKENKINRSLNCQHQ